MSFVNPLLAAWGADRPTCGGWVSTSDPLAAELRGYGAQGFRMLTVAWDAGLLEAGGRAELAAARGA